MYSKIFCSSLDNIKLFNLYILIHGYDNMICIKNNNLNSYTESNNITINIGITITKFAAYIFFHFYA